MLAGVLLRRPAPARKTALAARPLALLLVAAAAATPLGAAGVAMGSAAGPQPAAMTPAGAAVELPHLLTLPDPSAPVRYAPGALDRASHAQDWLRRLAETAGRRTGRAVPLRVLVLPREDWERLATGAPYGIPVVSGGGALALPASGDAGTVALWRAALPALPAVPGNPLMGSAEEAASLAAADFVAAPAAGEALALAAGFAPEEAWVGDLLGHLLALDAAYQERLGRAEAMLAFWRDIRRAPAGAGPLAAELRRHAALAAAAEAILGSERRTPGRALWKLQERAGGVLRAGDLRAAWPRPFATLDEARRETTQP